MSKSARTQPFVGRWRELDALERAHRGDAPVLMPVYGRRRVGKSELLVRFCSRKRAIYFAATQGARAHQLRSFLRSAAEALGEPLLAEAAVDGWEKALELVMRAGPRGSRLVVVLDEFQWLCESAPELPSVLQKLWDQRWQRERWPYLVLCGSYIGFMEREVLGEKAPLFGRRTGQLLVEPFGFREAAGFHPQWSLEDKARAYFVCGGVPAYLKAFRQDRSFEQNVISNFLEVDAPLFREAEFLLREELRDVGSYTTLIEALAAGQQTPTALGRAAGLATSQVMYFLNTLLRLGYVERRLPLVPGHPSRKETRYVVSEPVLRFWFRFVAPYYSAIRRGPADKAFAHHVLPQLESFCGAGFEAMCREAMPLLLEAERVRAQVRVGEFWGPKAQIDVVALRDDHWVELGECKWGKSWPLPVLAEELRTKARHYPPTGGTLQLRLFTRLPLRGKPPPMVKVHTLKHVYGKA